MKAAVLHEVNKPLVIEDVSVPNPGPREVLIRTAVAGLCHSDLHFMEGLYPHPLPAVLGHESAGVVEKVGSDVTYVKPGDHVVTCLSVFCGTCDNCTTGRTGAVHRHHGEDAAGRNPTGCPGRARRSSISFSISRPSPSRCWCTRTPSSKSGRTCRSSSRP